MSDSDSSHIHYTPLFTHRYRLLLRTGGECPLLAEEAYGLSILYVTQELEYGKEPSRKDRAKAKSLAREHLRPLVKGEKKAVPHPGYLGIQEAADLSCWSSVPFPYPWEVHRYEPLLIHSLSDPISDQQIDELAHRLHQRWVGDYQCVTDSGGNKRSVADWILTHSEQSARTWFSAPKERLEALFNPLWGEALVSTGAFSSPSPKFPAQAAAAYYWFRVFVTLTALFLKEGDFATLAQWVRFSGVDALPPALEAFYPIASARSFCWIWPGIAPGNLSHLSVVTRRSTLEDPRWLLMTVGLISAEEIRACLEVGKQSSDNPKSLPISDLVFY